MTAQIMQTVPYSGMRLIPPGRRSSNAVWYFRGKINGRRCEGSTGAKTEEEARSFIDLLLSERPTTNFARDEKEVLSIARGLMAGAKDRSRISGLMCTITKQDIFDMIMLANGRCSVSGVPFSQDKPNGSSRRPYTPSLDRIIPELGYTKENCRIVAFCVNVAMSDWGEDVLINVSQHVLWRISGK